MTKQYSSELSAEFSPQPHQCHFPQDIDGFDGSFVEHISIYANF